MIMLSNASPKTLAWDLFRLSVVILMCVSAARSWAAAKDNELLILSYNIHHGEGADGAFNLERIARIIRDSKAQLVALQEVDLETKRVGGTNTVAELARLTGMHTAFGKAMDYEGGQYGQAILSAFPLTNVATHLLPQREGREPRIALEATFSLTPESPALTFVTTHLDHQLDAVRQEQAAKILELFSGRPNRLILAGDFNSRPGSVPIKSILEKLADASAANPEPTIPSDKPRNKIDFIFFGPAKAFQAMKSIVLDEPVSSDHRPLLVKLKIQ
jgi:endonuclease/exonuclease/phosphatase family metal-dependent hydrolase